MRHSDEVQAYIDSHSEEQRAVYSGLEALIIQSYPQAEVRRSYGIVLYHVGKRWVGLGFRKDGVSLYTQYPDLIAEFKRKHASVKTGKGCLNFRLKDTIPAADVSQLIKSVIERL